MEQESNSTNFSEFGFKELNYISGLNFGISGRNEIDNRMGPMRVRIRINEILKNWNKFE